MEPEREGGPVVQAKYEDALAILNTQTYTLTADVCGCSLLPSQAHMAPCVHNAILTTGPDIVE
jgi:hypothetical protein